MRGSHTFSVRTTGGIDHGWVLGGPEVLIGHFQHYVRERLGRAR